MARTVDEIVASYVRLRDADDFVTVELGKKWLDGFLTQEIAPKPAPTWGQWIMSWLTGGPYSAHVNQIIRALKRRNLLTPRDELLIEIFWRTGLDDYWYWEALEQHSPRAAFVYSMRWYRPRYCIDDIVMYQTVSDIGQLQPARLAQLLYIGKYEMYLQLVDHGIAATDIVDCCQVRCDMSPLTLIRLWHTLPNLKFYTEDIPWDTHNIPPAMTILAVLGRLYGAQRVKIWGKNSDRLDKHVVAQLIFALVVAVSDGLLRPNGDGILRLSGEAPAASFLCIAARLPMELQIELMRCVAPDAKIRAIGDAEILWLGA